MALSFRHATAADAAVIAQLVNAAYRPGTEPRGWTHEAHLIAGSRTSADQVTALLAGTDILVGYIEDRVVSCVQIEQRGRDAYIGLLAVTPERQGAGLGAATLAYAEAYAAEVKGVERFLMLVVSAREELIAFYRRRGYRDSGERRNYPVGSGVGTPRGVELALLVLYKLAPDASSAGAVGGARTPR